MCRRRVSACARTLTTRFSCPGHHLSHIAFHHQGTLGDNIESQQFAGCSCTALLAASILKRFHIVKALIVADTSPEHIQALATFPRGGEADGLEYRALDVIFMHLENDYEANDHGVVKNDKDEETLLDIIHTLITADPSPDHIRKQAVMKYKNEGWWCFGTGTPLMRIARLESPLHDVAITVAEALIAADGLVFSGEEIKRLEHASRLLESGVGRSPPPRARARSLSLSLSLL